MERPESRWRRWFRRARPLQNKLSINNAGVMAYLAPSLEAAAAIWTVRSGESPHIVVGRGWPSWPAIAPQGDLLVFASDEPGGIYRISLDGTHLTKLTDMRGGPIALTPDGRDGSLCALGYHLWSVPVAGGTAREISSRSGAVPPQHLARRSPCRFFLGHERSSLFDRLRSP